MCVTCTYMLEGNWLGPLRTLWPQVKIKVRESKKFAAVHCWALQELLAKTFDFFRVIILCYIIIILFEDECV